MIGMPCSGPVKPAWANLASKASARTRAVGLTTTRALSAGPCWSEAAMRSRAIGPKRRQLSSPAFIAAGIAARVASWVEYKRNAPPCPCTTQHIARVRASPAPITPTDRVRRCPPPLPLGSRRTHGNNPLLQHGEHLLRVRHEEVLGGAHDRDHSTALSGEAMRKQAAAPSACCAHATVSPASPDCGATPNLMPAWCSSSAHAKPPGAGKSRLERQLTTILPVMSLAE